MTTGLGPVRATLGKLSGHKYQASRVEIRLSNHFLASFGAVLENIIYCLRLHTPGLQKSLNTLRMTKKCNQSDEMLRALKYS